MNLLRISQYIRRFIHVYLATWPGNYRARKLEILRELFTKSVEFMDNMGEEYWLDFGTLLGQYRNNDFIPHDIDVDVAMKESSYETVCQLKDDMPKGLSFFDTSPKHLGPKIYFSYKGYDLDIFFYREYGDKIKCYLEGAPPNENQLIDKKLVFPLNTVLFKGKEVSVPKNTRGYLEKMYGYLGTGGTRDKQTGLWLPPG